MKALTAQLAIASIVVLFMFDSAASAAEWQWSAPEGSTRAYLWIPQNCKRVRAVVVANHNMIEQGILEHPIMRKALADLGIAEVWIVPMLDPAFDFNKGAGDHFNRIMKMLADNSGYTELELAPVIPLGHSACASFPWNFAAWNPDRTLAVLSVHGDAPQTNLTGYGRAKVDWGDRNIDGIPGLMVMGEYEWGEPRLARAFDFVANHPKAPIAFLADAGHGHFDFSDQLVSFLAMFIRKAADERLPADETNLAFNQAVPLKPVDPVVGWRIDRWRKDKPPTFPPLVFASTAVMRKRQSGVSTKRWRTPPKPTTQEREARNPVDRSLRHWKSPSGRMR